MRKRRAVIAPAPKESHAVLGRDAVTGTLGSRQTATQHVALVIDGRVHAVSPVEGEPGRRSFSLPLPPHVLGETVDVLDVRDMQSVLSGTLDLGSARRLHWEAWVLESARVQGSFTLEGAALAGGPILVEICEDGVVHAEAFALPEALARGAAVPEGQPVRYRFTAALRHLLPLNGLAVLSPRVGGRLLPESMTLTGADLGFIGYADPSDLPLVLGWAVNVGRPHEPVPLELRIDGVLCATAVTSLPRPDIQSLGFAGENTGFHIDFPAGLSRVRRVQVEVVVAGTGLRLVNCPYIREGGLSYEGTFDGWEGPFATGWVVNLAHPDVPLEVEALCDGVIIGSAVAMRPREDVRAAGLPTAACGFRFRLDPPLPALFGRDVFLRVVGAPEPLRGSPRQLTPNPNVERMLSRSGRVAPPVQRRLAHRMTERTRGTLISIIMPVHNTPQDWLIEALASAAAQWSTNWELICVDDGSTEPHVKAVLEAFARRDPRFKVLHSSENVGIARAVNFGLRLARGSHVAFLDHDDFLEPDAVYQLALAAQQTGADLIYSDEALTTEDINAVLDVRARPAFSHDYYLSHPYFVHMVCVKAEIARRLGGWDERLAISADVDFILRVIEQAGIVAHVPRVLYRWRTHERSTGHKKQAEVMEATKAALRRHLARRGEAAVVSDGAGFNQFRLDWPDDGGEVLVVIPTKNRVELLKAAIDSIERTSPGANYRIVVIDHASTDPKTVRYLQRIAGRHTVMPYAGVFNYALMNNLAVRAHAGAAAYVLFMNNDVEAREPGWIGRMRSLCARPGIGAVGPMLLYGDDRVQHAGVMVGFAGAAEHVQKFAEAYGPARDRQFGYNCILTAVRDYSAVTAACMMVRRDAFSGVGGFDERFAIGFNDTDLCLRLGQAGYRILYDGATVLYHHESATRSKGRELDHPEDDERLRARWPSFFTQGDPFYSPALTASGMDHMLRTDHGCKGRLGVRAIDLHRPIAFPAAEPARRRRPVRTSALIAAE